MEPRRVIIIGGGAAGLSAAYTLKKRGINPILLEANDRVGGRLGGDRVDGFCLDEGADFFCGSYDVAFRLCEELGLPLIRSEMNLGWYRNRRWVQTTPIQSVGNLIRNLSPFWTLGFLSPRAVWAILKLVKRIKAQPEYLSFASNSRMAELDGEENFGDYLARIGVPEYLKVTLRGFLEMTMGHIEYAGAAYMRAYLAEMLLKADQIYVPEQGAGALTHALVEACGDIIRVSTPAKRVVIRDRAVTSVITDDGPIEADAVICALPATKVADVIPDLSAEIRHTLGKVTYSTGVRVVIGLDHSPLPVGWHGALYPEDETPLLLDRSINLPAITPPGKSMLDLLVGRDRAEELLPLDDEEIKHQMLGDVRRNPPPNSALPDDDEGLFTRVYRWKEAVCMMSPGMFKAVAEMRRQLDRDVKNLFLAGDYMRVPSVNGALASGVGAASQAAELLASRPA
ncbi:MAG: FAD-dependent oxidoreductase [Chlorobi bacterium]|nr:FAD-dependent oxidoreductase [Chlorobiota bacterium]